MSYGTILNSAMDSQVRLPRNSGQDKHGLDILAKLFLNMSSDVSTFALMFSQIHRGYLT